MGPAHSKHSPQDGSLTCVEQRYWKEDHSVTSFMWVKSIKHLSYKKAISSVLDNWNLHSGSWMFLMIMYPYVSRVVWFPKMETLFSLVAHLFRTWQTNTHRPARESSSHSVVQRQVLFPHISHPFLSDQSGGQHRSTIATPILFMIKALHRIPSNNMLPLHIQLDLQTSRTSNCTGNDAC